MEEAIDSAEREREVLVIVGQIFAGVSVRVEHVHIYSIMCMHCTVSCPRDQFIYILDKISKSD